jgi:hypothetical protein
MPKSVEAPKRHDVERHDVGDRPHGDQISAAETDVDDHLAIGAGEHDLACQGRARHRGRAGDVNELDIQTFLFPKARIVHHPERRIERAHRRPGHDKFLRSDGRSYQ